MSLVDARPDTVADDANAVAADGEVKVDSDVVAAVGRSPGGRTAAGLRRRRSRRTVAVRCVEPVQLARRAQQVVTLVDVRTIGTGGQLEVLQRRRRHRRLIADHRRPSLPRLQLRRRYLPTSK